jgi:zinc and cadmium transporter
MLGQIITATVIGGVFSLIGGMLLLWREKFARRASIFLVSFAIGSMTATALLELVPEALHEGEYETVGPWMVAGIFAFFLFEKVLHWYHVHEGDDDHAHEHDERQHDHRVVSTTVMLGDTLHNFIDGVALALAWSTGPALGITTTIAVFFHEVPQEMGDFGVLLHLGLSRAKVLWYNVASSLASVAGGIIGYVLLPVIGPYTPHLLGFAAGSFLYIAISDLLPELHRHKASRHDVGHILMVVLGILSIVFVGQWFHE